MNAQDHIAAALEIVTARDVPDEDFTRAVNDQAKLMAGVNPDELWNSDNH
jgi:hypothetical protein